MQILNCYGHVHVLILLKKQLKLQRKLMLLFLFLGLSQRLEGEEMPIKIDGFSGGDRTNLNLPAVQEQLLDAVCCNRETCYCCTCKRRCTVCK